jgi:hypothetical protein
MIRAGDAEVRLEQEILEAMMAATVATGHPAFAP